MFGGFILQLMIYTTNSAIANKDVIFVLFHNTYSFSITNPNFKINFSVSTDVFLSYTFSSSGKSS